MRSSFMGQPFLYFYEKMEQGYVNSVGYFLRLGGQYDLGVFETGKLAR